MQCNFGQCSKNEVSHECFCCVPVQFWKSSFFMLAKPNKLSVVCLLEQFIHWTLWLCELQYFINFCFLLHKDLSFRFLQKLDTEVNDGQSKESVYTWIKAVRPITREAQEGGKEGDRKEAQLQKQILTGQVGEGPAWTRTRRWVWERRLFITKSRNQLAMTGIVKQKIQIRHTEWKFIKNKHKK